MKESELQRKILNYIKSKGHYCFKVIQANKSGVPDVIVCRHPDGKFIALEIKRPSVKAKGSELQEYNVSCINEAGGQALVVNNLDDVKKLL